LEERVMCCPVTTLIQIIKQPAPGMQCSRKFVHSTALALDVVLASDVMPSAAAAAAAAAAADTLCCVHALTPA
jgi:hypothetical protein